MPRTPPHFKIRTTIANHESMVGVFEDDALFAMWVRAGIAAVERYADRTGDRFLVNRLDLMRIAATQPYANAKRKLRRLVAATPLRLRCECAGGPLEGRCECGAIWLEFPNFAKKQGFRSRNGTETEVSTTTTSSTTSLRERAAPPAPRMLKVHPRPSAEPAARKRSPLVNLLAREDGSAEEKRAWLAKELPLIEQLAEREYPADARRRRAEVRSRVIRHWRQHLKGLGVPAAAESRLMSVETQRRSRAADRAMALRRLYDRGLIRAPDEAAFRDWEAHGRPETPCWWDPGGAYRPGAARAAP